MFTGRKKWNKDSHHIYKTAAKFIIIPTRISLESFDELNNWGSICRQRLYQNVKKKKKKECVDG